MLLCTLLENGILNAKRGDVIVFNNTGAEHPKTYEFAASCKLLAETRFSIPFFWVEYQTYEDARNGEWTRLPSYRLTNTTPWSADNPDGYHSRGEPFEEMLSWSGYVPNQFSRTCTQTLKLESTRMFLRDWLACKESIPRLGHWQDRSQVNGEALYRRHRQNKGAVPKDIYLSKKEFVLSRESFRPEQNYVDFSDVKVSIENPTLDGKIYGEKADFGPGGIEYLAFVGLRGDEPMRVKRVEARAANSEKSQGYEGEHVYMPLATMHISKEDVQEFWDNQNWGLDLPASGNLSNCVYCFLKGTSKLTAMCNSMHSLSQDLEGTPADINWWVRIEQKYGRDIVAEGREIKNGSDMNFVGFFGSANKLTYADIAKNGSETLAKDTDILPCDCTD